MITTTITLQSGRKLIDLTPEEVEELRTELNYRSTFYPSRPFVPHDPGHDPGPPPEGIQWPTCAGDFYKTFGTRCG